MGTTSSTESFRHSSSGGFSKTLIEEHIQKFTVLEERLSMKIEENRKYVVKLERLEQSLAKAKEENRRHSFSISILQGRLTDAEDENNDLKTMLKDAMNYLSQAEDTLDDYHLMLRECQEENKKRELEESCLCPDKEQDDYGTSSRLET